MTDPHAPLGLNWTGHALMDHALAGHTVFAGQHHPADLTGADFARFADWAADAYFSPDMTSWISVAFTSNFINNQHSAETKRSTLHSLLTSYQRPGILHERCTYFPHLPAQGRYSRMIMPLGMGVGQINFYPSGVPGTPLSGLAVTALQGLAVSAPLVSGRLVIIDADDPELLLDIVRRWSPELTSRIDLSTTTGERTPTWTAARTRLTEVMQDVLRTRGVTRPGDAVPPGGVTLHHLSNSGQGPSMFVHHLQHLHLRFMQSAQQRHPDAWAAIRRAAHTPAKKQNGELPDAHYGTRNALDEALFNLPQRAPSFFRTHLRRPFLASLKPTRTKRKKTDPPTSTPPVDLTPLWNLTAHFLQEILDMRDTQITAIQTIGDALARWIADENDKRLFRNVLTTTAPGAFRSVLTRATLAHIQEQVRSGTAHREQQLLITDETYLRAFEARNDTGHLTFWLARDLLVMRVIQQLHDRQFFEQHPDDPDLTDLTLNTPDEDHE